MSKRREKDDSIKQKRDLSSAVNKDWQDKYMPRLISCVYSTPDLTALDDDTASPSEFTVASLLWPSMPKGTTVVEVWDELCSDRMKSRILRSLNMKLRSRIKDFHTDAMYSSNGHKMSISISDITIQRADSVFHNTFGWLCYVTVTTRIKR